MEVFETSMWEIKDKYKKICFFGPKHSLQKLLLLVYECSRNTFVWIGLNVEAHKFTSTTKVFFNECPRGTVAVIGGTATPIADKPVNLHPETLGVHAPK
jgi:hypothetical protein